MDNDIQYDLISSFLDGLKPTPMLTCSAWADNNRYLSTESSAEPGLWRTSRTPYLKEILDNLSPTALCNEVIVMKGVQLGFTESGLNAVGSYIDIAPCPILYVMPTIEMAKGLSKSRIDTMINACPALTEKIRPNRERDSGNNILSKSFPGGVLILAGSNSGSSLRSRPIRLLVLDEIDAYPLSIDEEGSPIALAEKRTITFPNKKIYKLSTPTISGISAIEKEIEGTDKRKYYVPLPCCGAFQTLEFENLIWEPGNYNSVHYKCCECGSQIKERFKTKFLAAGEWRSTIIENINPARVGYIINGLYSPLGWLSWPQIAESYERSKGDPILLRTFTNTILGETWKEKGDAPEWEKLYDRREKYKIGLVPKQVSFITIGVDVQKDRLEFEVVGWYKGKRSYSIDYRVIVGDTGSETTWQELAAVLNEQWKREDGALLPCLKMCIDTGYNTQHVYNFCRKQDPTRVIPVKGQDKQATIIAPPRQVDISRQGKKIGKVKVWHVGVSIIKSELYSWLRQRINEEGLVPLGYCHFPEYKPEYFRGLVAEQLEFKIIRGHRIYQWVKKYERNEPLDCRVYARAAATIVGIDRFEDSHWDNLKLTYNIGQKKEKKKIKRKKGDDFWN